MQFLKPNFAAVLWRTNMRNRFSSFAVASLALIALTAPASAKTVRECNDEYAANKPAIQGAGQLKKDFIAACRAGTETIPSGAMTAPAPAPTQAGPAIAPGHVKTVSQCNDEYAANKPAIQGAGQLKKDFIAACRAGTETIPSGAMTAPTQAGPAIAPAPMPTPNPPQAAPAAPAPTPATTISRPRTVTPTPSTGAGSPPGANQFATEAEAKSKCPSDTVVWVNKKSGVYHFSGTHNYGTTQSGTFMCEADAAAAGDRAAKNESHP
jgi:hypothetical protein